MRVLILADNCNPEWPSLPVVAYKAAKAISEHAEVVVVTHIRNRENIEKVGLGRATVRYVDSEYVARPMFKLATFLRGGTATSWTTAMAFAYPSYLAFEWEAWKALRVELLNGEFDLVHRLTPMSPTLPSPFARWSPVPFVLGPLNGGLPWPPDFRKELVREREWLSFVRNAYRILPFHRSTYKKSAAILAAFDHTIRDIQSYKPTSIVNFPEVGVDPGLFQQFRNKTTNSTKKILFVGRLVPYKLPQVVVRAFASQPILRSHRLTIVGDGPERQSIERLVKDCGLDSQVEMVGWKTQAEVAALLSESDIFVFPSIRELGAGAVVEAMACALACVVVDYGGPGTLISDERGVRVPLGNFEQLAQRFGEVLATLVQDEERITRLGLAAREHVMQFYTWEAKAKKTVDVYNWVLGRGPRPDFWSTGEMADRARVSVLR